MNTETIIAQAAAEGIRLTAEGTKLVLTGTKPPPQALIEALQQHKASIIASLTRELSEKSEKSPQRFEQVPETGVALAALPTRLSSHHEALLEAHLFRQGRPALDWVMRQANRYFEAFPQWGHKDCDHAAAFDLLIWQSADFIKSSTRWGAAQEVLALLDGLEEVANTVKETTT